HEPVAALEEDEPDLVAVDVLVHGGDPVREGGQLAEQLNTDQPAADYDESELAALARGVPLDVGALEPLDDVVAEQQTVGEGLEGEGIFRAGDHSSVGHPSEGEHELVVGHFTRFFHVGQVNYAAVQVDALDRGFDEARGPQERADREGAMAEVKCSGTDLEEQRRHHEEIVPAHNDEVDIRALPAEFFEVAGRVDSTEAAAEDYDSVRHVIPQRGQLSEVRGQEPKVETVSTSYS